MLTISLSASDWEVLMLVRMLKSPIMMWLSQKLADRSWNCQKIKRLRMMVAGKAGIC